MSATKELYRSPNGECWYLACDPSNGHGYVLQEPDLPSGSRPTRIAVGAFLSGPPEAPEQQALLRLIGTLVTPTPDGYNAGVVEKVRRSKSR